MFAILITLLTYIPYILLAYFGCQILTRLTSSINTNKKENFSHELEQGPFDEEENLKYNIPQPSEPLANNEDIQPTTEELDRQYDESHIGLDAKIVDPDVEAAARLEEESREYAPTPSNNSEEVFTANLLHGPFDSLEFTTSAPIDQ